LKAFQWYEEHGGGHHGLGDFNVMNKTYKMNKQPSLICRYLFLIDFFLNQGFFVGFPTHGKVLLTHPSWE
jgi:hypothetical protein